MAQQLNLFDARFAPQSLRFSARSALLLVLALLTGSALSAQALGWASRRAALAARATDTPMLPLRTQTQALSALDAGGAANELTQLQALAAGQRRIASALASGLAGAREGHADYLVALARRATASLWITGFAVSEDGTAIELEGRMTDATVLSDYLRSLNAEPRFKGRPFAQLSLKAVDGSSGSYTEFALRSIASSAQPSNAGPTP
jgi:Tfp pilus assembly protein PilN